MTSAKTSSLDKLFSPNKALIDGVIKPANTTYSFEKILAYVRVSDPSQIERMSLDIQADEIKKWAQERKKNAVIFREEGRSGGSLSSRIALRSLLSNLSKDDVLVTTADDRLSRSTQDIDSIISYAAEQGAFIVYLNNNISNDNNKNNLLLNISKFVSSEERERIKEKSSLSLKKLKDDNELRPRPPFGKRWVGKDKPYEDDPAEIKTIEVIKELVKAKPSITDNAVAKFLNDNEFPPKSKSKTKKLGWNCKSVRTVRAQQQIYSEEKLKDPEIKAIHDKYVSHFYGGKGERTGKKRTIVIL